MYTMSSSWAQDSLCLLAPDTSGEVTEFWTRSVDLGPEVSLEVLHVLSLLAHWLANSQGPGKDSRAPGTAEVGDVPEWLQADHLADYSKQWKRKKPLWGGHCDLRAI